ncbi:MAG: hypothetical protein ACOYD1_07630 [Candidatus Nanopelagicales bacterium]
MRSLDKCRDEYWDWCFQQAAAAEEACNGNLIDSRCYPEIRRCHGSVFSALWRTSAATAWRYASPELRNFWHANQRLTFTEFAWAAGFRHKFIRQGKYRAESARSAAELRAQERDYLRRPFSAW